VTTVDGLPGVRVQQCRSCKADILWATTVKGKSMPVDVEPRADGNVWLTVDHHLLFAQVVTQAPLIAVPLRHSHMETCPNRAAWQPKRGRRG
jgi:hypothetical protein